MIGLLTILAYGLAVTIVAATWWTMHRLRRPPRRTYASAVARGIPGDPSELASPRAFETWTAHCEMGAQTYDLAVWDIEGDDGEAPVVLCTPGWGDSRIGALARVRALAPVASRIIAWDPPGLGESPGLCDLGLREHKAIACIVDQLSDEAQQRGVVLYGWSLGAGASVVAAGAMANDPRVRGVVAEAPYRLATTPARNVIRNAAMPWAINGPLAFWLLGLRLGVGPFWRGFDRASHARLMSQPILVLHGTHDDVCPVDDGRSVAQAASRGLFVGIEGGGHNDLWVDETFTPQCERTVRDFMTSLRLQTRETTPSA